MQRVGFLATGDELIHGDVFNTNTPSFAQICMEHGIAPGQHLLVGDCATEIEAGVHYLLQSHQALITIGGLGPTSDDQTRFGLANALGLAVEFHHTVWDWIVTHLTSKKLTIPENNRQQALFPTGAIPMKNDNGTAAACYLPHNGCDIFMLPGPPKEATTLFNTYVIPQLITQGYATEHFRHSWLLHGVSESHIASQLDPLIPQLTGCQLGYRIDYPHLEIKLSAKTEKDLAAASAIILPFFSKNIINEQRRINKEK